MEETVTIVDKDILKVLSGDTRLKILKELSQGNRTPSDLGKKFSKSNSTILEHLDILVKAGLVTKIEQPGRKWVFYTLTDKGKSIIENKNRRLVILLSLTLVVAGFTIFSVINYTSPDAFKLLIGERLVKTPIEITSETQATDIQFNISKEVNDTLSIIKEIKESLN